ncbi:hypothetical protein [Oceanobacillus profundus]|uniref:hypothetical protein n=1 Tax=Oceanobacillus TaxID=182709 RepID=UPI001EFFC9D0|nr:hypothetical protein [Oceanobacillus profundus]
MLPLTGMLAIYYRIHPERKILFGNKEGYKQGDSIYFTISGRNKETILTEQAAVTYFLKEQPVEIMTLPIPNLQGEWFTSYGENIWMVIQMQQVDNREYSAKPAGIRLAEFHQIGTAFGYEPKSISSYGKWKALWIDKLTAFETGIEREAKEKQSEYNRALMNFLPYIIGISENAIQFLQESERERRILETDQGTITFNRYESLDFPVIWTDQLVYDHPARDIAEYIRSVILNNDKVEKTIAFLNDYQQVAPISVFGWRLVYARLLFPIHLFDFIERGFTTPDIKGLEKIIEQQSVFESFLSEFFEITGVDAETWGIPMVHWL